MNISAQMGLFGLFLRIGFYRRGFPPLRNGRFMPQPVRQGSFRRSKQRPA